MHLRLKSLLSKESEQKVPSEERPAPDSGICSRNGSLPFSSILGTAPPSCRSNRASVWL